MYGDDAVDVILLLFFYFLFASHRSSPRMQLAAGGRSAVLNFGPHYSPAPIPSTATTSTTRKRAGCCIQPYRYGIHRRTAITRTCRTTPHAAAAPPVATVPSSLATLPASTCRKGAPMAEEGAAAVAAAGVRLSASAGAIASAGTGSPEEEAFVRLFYASPLVQEALAARRRAQQGRRGGARGDRQPRTLNAILRRWFVGRQTLKKAREKTEQLRAQGLPLSYLVPRDGQVPACACARFHARARVQCTLGQKPRVGCPVFGRPARLRAACR